jgi:hypothetical protein
MEAATAMVKKKSQYTFSVERKTDFGKQIICDIFHKRMKCIPCIPKLKKKICIYKVIQILPGQTVTCLHTNRLGHI